MEAIVDLGALDRAGDGDLSAFDALVEARVGSMLRTAMAIAGDETEARDAVQDALMSAWRQLGWRAADPVRRTVPGPHVRLLESVRRRVGGRVLVHGPPGLRLDRRRPC